MNKKPEDSIDCRAVSKIKIGRCSIGFKNYFNDPYHFTNKGYIVLAQEFDKIINYMISKGVF